MTEFCRMRANFTVILNFFLLQMASASVDLNYHITISEPQTHYAEVRITVSNFKSDKLHFSMPVWTPGSYLVREFEKSVEDVKAVSGDIDVPVKRISKNTWECDTKKFKTLAFIYRVYAYEFSVRTSFIDADHAFLHNTSIFMMVEQFKNSKGTLSIRKPGEWKRISTSLDPGKTSSEFLFENYDLLADSPIEIGNHEVLKFTAGGVPHEAAIIGRSNIDTVRFKKDLQRVCESMTGIFGEHPSKRYVFFVQNQEAGGGGLEHLNSCCVVIPRWNWSDVKKYQAFLGLCAHEYFHLWNVKRLRPIELGPFDYGRENYTRQLWVAEGITSYYDEMEILKMGWIKPAEYVGALEAYVNALENRPGVKVQSLAESSYDAWVKEYRQNENSKNTTISYYQKGLVISMLLDARIVVMSGGKRNLDDLLRELYNNYYKKLGRGFSEKEFMQAAEKVAGASLGSFFDDYLYSVKTPDYEKIMGEIGISVKQTQVEMKELGITTALENGKTMVKFTLRGSSAYTGGINVNDELTSINGVKVNNNADEVLRQLAYAAELQVEVMRGGLTRVIAMPFAPYFQVHYDLILPEVLSPEQQLLFNKWARR